MPDPSKKPANAGFFVEKHTDLKQTRATAVRDHGRGGPSIARCRQIARRGARWRSTTACIGGKPESSTCGAAIVYLAINFRQDIRGNLIARFYIMSAGGRSIINVIVNQLHARAVRVRRCSGRRFRCGTRI